MLEQAIRRPIPFYGSYASFYRAMHALKGAGLPRRVESRILFPHLQGEASRIVSGFSSLGWIDESGHPSDDLRSLVDAFGGDSWRPALANVVPRAYSFIPDAWDDLTPEKLHEAFVSYTGREADVLTSAETFFLCLAYEGGFHLSERFYRRAVRAVSDAKRFALIGSIRRGSLPDETSGSLGETSSKLANPIDGTLPDTKRDWVQRILDLAALVDEQDMTDREKNAVLILLSYLRKREQKAREDDSA